MEQWSFDHLSQLLYLLLASTNITVGHIRLLFHLKQVGKGVITCKQTDNQTITKYSSPPNLHHGDSGVDFRRQRNVDLILVSVNPGKTDRTLNLAYS